MRGRMTVNAREVAIFLAIVGLAVLGSATAYAQGRPGDTGQDARQFGLGAPASVGDLPAGAFRSRLQSMPPQARARALEWLQDFSFTDHDLDFLDADDEGGVLYVDSVLSDEGEVIPEEIPLYEQDGSGGLSDICAGAAVQASGVPSLHSKPGSGSGPASHPFEKVITQVLLSGVLRSEESYGY